MMIKMTLMTILIRSMESIATMIKTLEMINLAVDMVDKVVDTVVDMVVEATVRNMVDMVVVEATVIAMVAVAMVASMERTSMPIVSLLMPMPV